MDALRWREDADEAPGWCRRDFESSGRLEAGSCAYRFDVTARVGSRGGPGGLDLKYCPRLGVVDCELGCGWWERGSDDRSSGPVETIPRQEARRDSRGRYCEFPVRAGADLRIA